MISNQVQHNPLHEVTMQQSGLVKTENGFTFRDLNKNGKLDVYEDPRQPIDARVDDLLGQMTLEEKAGLLFINGAVVNADGSIEDKPGAPGFATRGRDSNDPPADESFQPLADPGCAGCRQLVQQAPASLPNKPGWVSRLPSHLIPATISLAISFPWLPWIFRSGVRPWALPRLMMLELVRKFADIVRKEYLAVGIRVALHPQIDLATEPRWPRISGTFGEDAHLSARLTKAYIEGFQGETLGPHSVACMTKHFPGGGPQNEGLDPHFEFQKGQIYPGNNFDYHLIPFEAAFAAQTAAIMPYYGVPMDQTDENVAMSFNKAIITGLLREKYQYDGVVCTDWGLITDAHMPDTIWPARAWGVEHLSEVERVGKALEAGVDQFGGESCPEHVVELVKTGRLSEARLDQSVRRLLRLKFQLGLFDNPFVDEAEVSRGSGPSRVCCCRFSLATTGHDPAQK